jgi:MFS family permease
MASFTNRIMRAAKLDAAVYEEVEADKRALGQAMGVVVLSSIAAGLGSIGGAGLGGILVGTITALIGWFIWAYLTYFIGTKLLPEPQTKANPGELLRTIGFSSSPGLIRVLGIIPGLRSIVFLVGGIWMLVAMVIAVRQALDYKSTLRALGVCIIGWIIQAAFLRALGVCIIGWIIQAAFFALLFFVFGGSGKQF